MVEGGGVWVCAEVVEEFLEFGHGVVMDDVCAPDVHALPRLSVFGRRLIEWGRGG